jgi:hypothetical protein
MGSEGLPLDRLREFLRELTPEARVMLFAELERAKLRGHELPRADLILRELRALVPPEQKPKRLGDPQRLFFAPLQPFLLDEQLDRRQRGRVSRASLAPIWQWLTRDLVPVEATAYAEHVSRHLLIGDEQQVEVLSKAFQDRVVQRVQETLQAVSHDDKARRRLAAQIGARHGLEELREVVNVMKARDALAVIASPLPAQIRNLADEQLDNVKTLLDSPVARHPDVFLYGLLVVRSRLTPPWQLIRVATKAVASDEVCCRRDHRDRRRRAPGRAPCRRAQGGRCGHHYIAAQGHPRHRAGAAHRA